jgi:hypothetical protein
MSLKLHKRIKVFLFLSILMIFFSQVTGSDLSPGIIKNKHFQQIIRHEISVDNTIGCNFLGETEEDYLGVHVSGIGDVNNDGYDDFIVGAPFKGNQAGKAYLILGRSDNSWTEFNLSHANASFIGENDYDWAGRWTAGVGDVNGDNYDDFAISSIFNDPGLENAGQTYIFFGGVDKEWKINTSLLQANASFIGEGVGDQSGHGVYGIGDINHDGFDDILISGMYNDEGGTDAGQVYVIFGRPTDQWTMGLSLTYANASYIGNGEEDQLGLDAAGVGDVNKDGFSDFVVGAWITEQSVKVRKLYLILGGNTDDWTTDKSISQNNGSFVNEKDTGLDSMVFSLDWISGAGDVNNDGYDDIIFGVYEDDEGIVNAGQTYLFFGRATDKWMNNLSFSQANASFINQIAQGWSGSSVSGVGDVNDDGFDDFLIGSPGQFLIENAYFKGRADLFLGKPSLQWTVNMSLTNADISFGDQPTGDGFGFHVSSVGDVNNDGFPDFTISAPYSANKAGKVYLILHPFHDKTSTEISSSSTTASDATTTTTPTPSPGFSYFVLFSLIGLIGIKKRILRKPR